MTLDNLDFHKMVEETKQLQQHDTDNGIMINLFDDDTVDKDFLETKMKPSAARFKLENDEDFKLTSDMYRRVKSKLTKSMKRLRD